MNKHALRMQRARGGSGGSSPSDTKSAAKKKRKKKASALQSSSSSLLTTAQPKKPKTSVEQSMHIRILLTFLLQGDAEDAEYSFVFEVRFKKRPFGLELDGLLDNRRMDAVVTKSHDVHGQCITKGSRLVAINGESCKKRKFERVKIMCRNATLPALIQFAAVYIAHLCLYQLCVFVSMDRRRAIFRRRRALANQRRRRRRSATASARRRDR